MLRRLINLLIIYFFRASQYNYSYKMLYYRQNLSLVNTPELLYIILASSIINQLGGDIINKLINLRLKYLNSSYKIKIKYYKNSTYNINIIFNRVYLSNIQVRALRIKLEYTFSKYISSTYITASIVLDIFLLARNLYSRDLAKPRSTNYLAGGRKFFDSENILQISIDRLAEKVILFN